MNALQHPFPAVRKDGFDSFGGNQGWSPKKYIQRSGCGLISCTDSLLYLNRHRPSCQSPLFRNDSTDSAIPLDRYNRWSDQFRRRYLPVIPCFGTTGFFAAASLNRYFRGNQIALKASWNLGTRTLWKDIASMLRADIPVILAIGPNFPLPVRRHKLTFYHGADHKPACQVAAHFVTVTGMDKDWLRISSWGKEYFIARDELMNYISRYGCSLTSNIIKIRPLDKKSTLLPQK